MMFDGIATMAGHIQAKKVKALATTGKTRSTTLPNVPTLNESALPGYEVLAWNGVMVPAGTPRAIVDKLNVEISKLASRAEVKEAWAKQAVDPIVMSPQEFDKFIRAEIAKWAEVVRVSGAKVE
jgi:tripartite-type tricarboxylate transporter receptor subunit TctC